MLPAAHRLTESTEFQRVTRQGRRAGSRTLVAHWDQPAGTAGTAGTGSTLPAAVGFAVSKQVGGSVVRNRVKRRLRHAVRERLAGLPGDGRLVVRALPAAAAASYQELGADLDRCLERVLRQQAEQRAPR